MSQASSSVKHENSIIRQTQQQGIHERNREREREREREIRGHTKRICKQKEVRKESWQHMYLQPFLFDIIFVVASSFFERRVVMMGLMTYTEQTSENDSTSWKDSSHSCRAFFTSPEMLASPTNPVPQAS
jgi:hypothetical protein